MFDTTYIIAEAGVNHNGDINLAYQLIDAASDAGATAVKFQTFRSELLVSKFADKAEYQKNTTKQDESQLEMIQKLELSYSQYADLNQYCKQKNIVFLSTPFDLESIDFLDSLAMPFWKIPSGEITNLPYLMKIAQTKKPVVLSTGMSTIREIEQAIALLKENGTPAITLLHCNTAYPTPYDDVNLNAIPSMQQHFQCPIGYSDHTVGIFVPIAAIALGAKIIEKHFTLSRYMNGPDHHTSLEPHELKEMIQAIRIIEASMGQSAKNPSSSELINRHAARKSIVAKRDICAGEIFSPDNLTVKRPGNGLSPMMWFGVIGQYASQNFLADELIFLKDQ